MKDTINLRDGISIALAIADDEPSISPEDMMFIQDVLTPNPSIKLEETKEEN